MTRDDQNSDTTLQDGEQSPGRSMNVEEKLMIAKQLARPAWISSRLVCA